jgi:hypothetical protein
MTYAGATQPFDGGMLPLNMTTRCFATVTQPHTNVIRYLCGDGEDCGGGEDASGKFVRRTGTAAGDCFPILPGHRPARARRVRRLQSALIADVRERPGRTRLQNDEPVFVVQGAALVRRSVDAAGPRLRRAAIPVALT